MNLKSVENVITLGKLIGLFFLILSPPPLYFVFENKRNDFARHVMGTIFLVGERAKRARHSQVCSIENRIYIYTRIMVTIKKRAGVIPYSFSSSIALLSSLLSCSFYLLDLRTISSVDILEMT